MPRPIGLTARQTKVVELIAAGMPNKEIAHVMAISEAGVKKHIEALMRHYRVQRRTALVQRAISRGDVSLERSIQLTTRGSGEPK